MKTLNFIFAFLFTVAILMVPVIIIFLIWLFSFDVVKILLTDLVVIVITAIGYFLTNDGEEDEG